MFVLFIGPPFDLFMSDRGLYFSRVIFSLADKSRDKIKFLSRTFILSLLLSSFKNSWCGLWCQNVTVSPLSLEHSFCWCIAHTITNYLGIYFVLWQPSGAFFYCFKGVKYRCSFYKLGQNFKPIKENTH